MKFRKLIKVLTTTACIVLLGIPVQSEDKWDFFCLNIRNPDHATRIKLAKKLLEHWKVIDKSIPRLSPSEEEWLKKEEEAGRLMSRLDSPEFSIKTASLASEQIVKCLTFLSKDKFKSKKQEVVYWAVIYYHMGNVNSDFYYQYSKLIKLMKVFPPAEAPLREDKSVQDFLYTNCASAIYENIILHYFLDKLPD